MNSTCCIYHAAWISVVPFESFFKRRWYGISISCAAIPVYELNFHRTIAAFVKHEISQTTIEVDKSRLNDQVEDILYLRNELLRDWN